MGTLIVADRAEQKTRSWNGKVEDQAEAKALFEEAMASGAFMAYALTMTPEGVTREVVKEFKPEAEEIVVVPRLVGG